LLAQISKLANSQFPIPGFRISVRPVHFEKRETPEIELNEQVKCGGEQLIAS